MKLMNFSVFFFLQVTKSIISLLNYYGWKKFSIIHEEPWKTVANSLKEQAKAKNMTINHSQEITDYHKCCEKDLPCCGSGFWFQVFLLLAPSFFFLLIIPF